MTREEYEKSLNYVVNGEQEPCEDADTNTGDMIGRQAAIEDLPSVKPQEPKPCTDAINRDKTIVKLSHLLSDWNDDWNVPIHKCIETVKNMPSVTSQKKTGHWIFTEHMVYCSECAEGFDRLYLNGYHYCPECGAKMATDDEIIICEYYRDQGHYKCCYGQKNAPRTNCGGDKRKCECQ